MNEDTIKNVILTERIKLAFLESQFQFLSEKRSRLEWQEARPKTTVGLKIREALYTNCRVWTGRRNDRKTEMRTKRERRKERKPVRRKEEADAKVVRNDEPLGVLFLRLLLRAILCLSVSSSLVSFPPTAEVRSFVGSSSSSAAFSGSATIVPRHGGNIRKN